MLHRQLGLDPEDFPNAEAIWAIIIRGREMGLGALTALDTFHIIEGKPALSANLLAATIKRSGKYDYRIVA